MRIGVLALVALSLGCQQVEERRALHKLDRAVEQTALDHETKSELKKFSREVLEQPEPQTQAQLEASPIRLTLVLTNASGTPFDGTEHLLAVYPVLEEDIEVEGAFGTFRTSFDGSRQIRKYFDGHSVEVGLPEPGRYMFAFITSQPMASMSCAILRTRTAFVLPFWPGA